VARTTWRLADDELRAVTRTAIEAAFIDEVTRSSLLARSQD
jgi:adenosine deaminase